MDPLWIKRGGMMGKDYDLIVFVRTKHNNLGENVDFWKKCISNSISFLQFRKIENYIIKKGTYTLRNMSFISKEKKLRYFADCTL